MRCMKTKTTHGDKDPNPRNKYNLAPETARVGVQMGKVTSGALQPTRFLCRMRATELKIVGERQSRSPGEGEVAFYASKTDINHVSI